MKQSEAIRIEAANDMDDNDMRDINYIKKIERAERNESFQDNILPLLKAKYPVTYEARGDSYEIITEKYGRLKYFPRAASLFIAKNNQWMKKPWAFKWLQKWVVNS